MNSSTSTTTTLALLRVVSAIVYMQHGAQKFFPVFGGPSDHLGPLQIAGGTIELVGGALILLGLFTRLAAFISSGEMAVAYFMFHFPRGFWPVMNHGETPTLLCFIFLFLAAAGGGAYALDAVLSRRRDT